MKCPYCGETVQDGVMVCHACRRDIALYTHIMQQVEQQQATIDNLKSTVELLCKQGALASSLIPDSNLVPVTLSLLLSVGLSFAFYWISWQQIAGSRFDILLLFLSSAAPFIAALWLGLCSSRLGMPARALLGLLAGALGFSQMFFVFHANAFVFDRLFFLLKGIHYSEVAPIHNLWLILATYLASGLCLFIFGYGMGERLRDRSNPVPLTPLPAANSGNNSILRPEVLKPISEITVALMGVVSAAINVWVSKK